MFLEDMNILIAFLGHVTFNPRRVLYGRHVLLKTETVIVVKAPRKTVETWKILAKQIMKT